ncbi:MAG: hypothetical protein Q8P49_04585 [Candidatus Liptonbacteria bacterium]|nr:hypothetical protein [Candidatus Liptonbacteria bacterium]
MKKGFKRVTILTIGTVFIVLGILGLALPLLQGMLFLAIGVMLISLYSPATRAWMEKYLKRHPKLRAAVEKAEKWIANIIGGTD